MFEEFEKAVEAHVSTLGERGWEDLRGQFPGVSDSTFWRWLRRTRGGRVSRPRRARTAPAEARERTSGPGFVYVAFIEAEGRALYKVGKSESPLQRIRQHQTSSPFEVKVASIYFTPDMQAEERTLHRLFSEKKVRGEWFALGQEDLQVVGARALIGFRAR
jgi:hypothetical protein